MVDLSPEAHEILPRLYLGNLTAAKMAVPHGFAICCVLEGVITDLSKVSMNQKCRISPEAYPDKVYQGRVAEIAPEADRQKGTLQVKVQIENPDHFLTPELSAKVEFLKQ